MSGTGLFSIKLRQLPRHYEFHVFLYRPLCRTENLDPLGLQFHESPHADPSNRNRVHFPPFTRLQALAHTMCVMQIIVTDLLHDLVFRIDDNETRSRSEMRVYRAFQPFQVRNWKTNFHKILPKK
jgi:hypothetical protein